MTTNNRICVKCFQFLNENEEKMHKTCFPITHPPISINIETNFPVSVVMEVLKRANIKVHTHSSSTMTTMNFDPQTFHTEATVEEMSESESESEVEEVDMKAPLYPSQKKNKKITPR